MTESLTLDRPPIPLRPDQEPERTTSYVGMVVFLGSWAVLFSCLFFMFAMFRLRAPVWPPEGSEPLPIALPAFNTLVIAASSVALHRASQLLRQGQALRFGSWLMVSTALAATFFALQVYFWLDLWSQGIRIASALYASYFYLLTVFHGLHVLVGLGLLSWLIPQVRKPATPRRAVRVKLVTMFWHFVGVVWVLMFFLLFVV
jgi:cytochrome c oxidase subunit III